jgi:RecA-family ATPase
MTTINFEEFQRHHSADAVEPFPFVLPRDITLEPKAFLIDGFVGVGETSVWYGPPDGGKSTVVLDAGCHVAAGIDYYGPRVTQGAVLYVAIERGAVVKRRVLAWCHYHNRMDIPLAVVTEMIDLRSGHLDADRIIATATVFSTARGQPVAWIIIDTLNRALAGGDENSSRDMGMVIAAVDRIQRETGAHCSLVHHVPVDRTDRMRGHSSVLGAVDLTVRITKDDKTVSVEADKANDLVEKPRFAFQFRSVEIACNADTHEVITAPVLVPCDVVIAPKVTRKLSDRNKLALAALTEAVLNNGQPAPTGFELPQGTCVVPLTNWRDEMFRRGVLEHEAPNPRQDFKRVREALAARQLIGLREDFVWPVLPR